MIKISNIKLKIKCMRSKLGHSEGTDKLKLYTKHTRAGLLLAKKYIGDVGRIGFMQGVKRAFCAFRDYCIRHKKGLYKIANFAAPVVAIFLLVFTISFFNGRSYALVLDCNGQKVGAVNDEATLGQVVTDINQNLSSEVIQEKEVKITPQYTLAPVEGAEPDKTEEIKHKIIETSDSDIKQGSGLYVNNRLIGFVGQEHTQQLNSEIDDKLSEAQAQQPQDATVDFYDNVVVKDGIYPQGAFKSISDMESLLESKTTRAISYISKEGDTIESIAQNSGVSAESIEEKNPTIKDTIIKEDTKVQAGKDTNSGKIIPGTVVNIEKESQFLPVKVVTRQSYTAAVPFENTDQPNDKEYTSYSKVLQQGEIGSVDCVDDVTVINGIEIGRVSVSRVITKEPKKQLTSIGTKPLPTTPTYAEGTGNSTGSFMWPVPESRTISSPFGERWGSLHSGIDIQGGATGGQVIVAADGGKVVKSSNSGDGYGNCIIIEHSGGYSTLYGHCATLIAPVGALVSKGQPIGIVGSTGYSTGPHLHFEIKINGKAIDPLTFVKSGGE